MESKYIPLYRKYRPQTFHDLIGQENIASALSNAVKLNRISHAYLLTGPRGTGKTSSARILAKSLNCKEGPTLEPCGKCPACLDIMNSIPADVIEIDAASNRSVEDTQAILEKIQYVPVNGRYKIYIIDEVHMLSNTAFNALLKTLEEPPENVIFILATTEPQKVLETIISRCQRFDFRRITSDDIVKRLEYIAGKENINISKDALHTIAKNSQGGMRDALSLLDQISVFGAEKEITSDDVNELLGRISYDKLYELAQCIVNSDCNEAVHLIDEVYSKGNEPVQLLNNLTRYFRDLMIIKNCTDKELIFSLTNFNEENYEKNKQLADKFETEDIIIIIDKLADYTAQTKDASDKYLRLEMCIIDLADYKNLPSAKNLLKRIEALENQAASGASVQRAAVQRPAAVHNFEAEKPAAAKSVHHAAAAPQSVLKPASGAAAKEAPRPAVENAGAAAVSSDIHKVWVSVLQSISSLTAKAYFQKASPVELSENRILISFSNDMFIKMADKNKKQALSDAVTAYLGIKNPNIEIVSGADIPNNIMPAQPPAAAVSEPVSPDALPAAFENEEKKDIQAQEEEEYQTYMAAENKKQASEETPKKEFSKENAASSQADMVKDLFDGKFIE